MTKAKPLPDIEYLRQCFIADYVSGKLFWKTRPENHFNSSMAMKVFNSKFAGKEAKRIKPDGRCTVKIMKKEYRRSRILFCMYHGFDSKLEIDHINRDQSCDAITNLREATRLQNSANMSNRGRYMKGVRRLIGVKTRPWQSRICVGKNVIYLGVYETEQDAHDAYCSAAKIHFGEFCCTK